MASKAFARCEVLEEEAEFEIENFEIACQACTNKVKKGVRELASKPIVRVGDVSIGILVNWFVHEKGTPKEDTEIGIAVRFFGAKSDSFQLGLSMSILNVASSRTITLGGTREILTTSGSTMAGNDWGWSCEKVKGTGETPTLRRIFDATKGWLHTDSLRVTAKVLIPNEVRNEPSKPLMLNLQHELSDALRTLLTSKHNADVTLVVGDTKVEAHSIILSARSPVFAAMFASGMKEAESKEVAITDLEPSAVKELVSFLYTGCVPEQVLQDDSVALPLLKAAHRYECAAVVDACASALSSRLTAESATPTFQVADLLGCADLREECLQFAHVNAAAVLEAASCNEFLMKGSPAVTNWVKALAMPPAKRSRSA